MRFIGVCARAHARSHNKQLAAFSEVFLFRLLEIKIQLNIAIFNDRCEKNNGERRAPIIKRAEYESNPIISMLMWK